MWPIATDLVSSMCIGHTMHRAKTDEPLVSRRCPTWSVPLLTSSLMLMIVYFVWQRKRLVGYLLSVKGAPRIFRCRLWSVVDVNLMMTWCLCMFFALYSRVSWRLSGLLSRAVRVPVSWLKCSFHTIRYDTRCYFNVRSKANMSQLNLPHGTDN